jgi:putative sterol carrier protein
MADNAAEFFASMKDNIPQDKIKDLNATYQWDLTGDGGGKWFAKFSGGEVEIGEGEAESSDITITVSAQDWMDIATGKLNGQMAFLQGKLKVKGDMTLAMKLQSLTG